MARDKHLYLEPCGFCSYLEYLPGFWCPKVCEGILDSTDDGPVVTFLAWLVHDEVIPDCPTFRRRQGSGYSFRKVKTVRES